MNPNQPDSGGQPPRPIPQQPYYGQPAPPPVMPSGVPMPGQTPVPTQYDFILSPEKPSKLGFIATGSSMKRAGVIVGGLVLLVIIGVIVASVLGGGGFKAAPLITVLQEQTELVRVASAGEPIVSQQNTQQLAYAVELSSRSARQQLTTYLTQNHQTVAASTLTLKHSTQADTQLTSAQANSTYDSVFTGIIQNDLANYEQALKTAYAANPGPKGRQLLSTEYNGAQLLIQQSKQ